MGVVLAVLWIVAVILLWILGILILLLLVALFCPLFYRARIDKTEKLSAFAGASWLLGCLSASVAVEDSAQTVSFRILFFKKRIRLSQTEEKTEKPAAKKSGDAPKTSDKTSIVKAIKALASNTEESAETDEPKSAKIGFADYYSLWKGYPFKKGLFREIKLLVIRIIKSLRRIEIKIDQAQIGLSEPDTTAYISAARYIVEPFLRQKWPDFDSSAIEMNYYGKIFHVTGKAKGRIILWDVAFPLVLLYFSKPVRKLNKSYKALKKAKASDN